MSLALLGVVATGLLRGLWTSQRAYLAQAERAALQQNLRAAMAILPAALRELDAADSDITAMSATSITLRATEQVTFLCTVPEHGAGGLLTLRVRERPFFGTRASFMAGDSVLLYHEGDPANRSDDDWVRGLVLAATNQDCPDADRARPGYELMLRLAGPGLPGGLTNGSPLRGFATVTYALYRSGDMAVVPGAAARRQHHSAAARSTHWPKRSDACLLRSDRRPDDRPHGSRGGRAAGAWSDDTGDGQPRDPGRAAEQPTAMTGPTHAERGMALALALGVLVLVGVLAATVTFLGVQEARVGESMRRVPSALGVAEEGAAAVIRTWDPTIYNRSPALPIDSVAVPDGYPGAWAVAALKTGAYGGHVFKLNGELYLIDIVARDSLSTVPQFGEGGEVRQHVGVVAHVRPVASGVRAALTAGKGVRLSGPVRVDGADHVPPGWGPCGPPDSQQAGVRVPAGATVVASGASTILGSPPTATVPTGSVPALEGITNSQLAAWATHTVAGRSFGSDIGPVVVARRCDEAVATNWGDSRGPNYPCGNYFPVVHVSGDATGERHSGARDSVGRREPGGKRRPRVVWCGAHPRWPHSDRRSIAGHRVHGRSARRRQRRATGRCRRIA